MVLLSVFRLWDGQCLGLRPLSKYSSEHWCLDWSGGGTVLCGGSQFREASAPEAQRKRTLRLPCLRGGSGLGRLPASFAREQHQAGRGLSRCGSEGFSLSGQGKLVAMSGSTLSTSRAPRLRPLHRTLGVFHQLHQHLYKFQYS